MHSSSSLPSSPGPHSIPEPTWLSPPSFVPADSLFPNFATALADREAELGLNSYPSQKVSLHRQRMDHQIQHQTHLEKRQAKVPWLTQN